MQECPVVCGTIDNPKRDDGGCQKTTGTHTNERQFGQHSHFASQCSGYHDGSTNECKCRDGHGVIEEGGKQGMQIVTDQDENDAASGEQFKEQDESDDALTNLTERGVGNVGKGVQLCACGEEPANEFARVVGKHCEDQKENQADNPTGDREGVGEGEEAHTDHDVDKVETGLSEG